MKVKILSIVSLIGLCLGLTSCAVLPPKLELPNSIETISELDDYLEVATTKGSPPSISLLVTSDSEIAHSKFLGFIDSAQSQKPDIDTVYQWWSITKLFTAVAVLQLAEQELISLDDPISKHIPFFAVRNGEFDATPITARHLLSHSSGLRDIGFSILGWIHYQDDSRVDQEQLLKDKLPKYNRLKAAPGDTGMYSNLGYLVLAVLIESVTGDTYENYIHKNILKPLKMNTAGFAYSDAMSRNEAIGSHPKDLLSFIVPALIDTKKAIGDRRDGRLWFNRVFSDQKGATGLIGSPRDIQKFMRALLGGGVLDGTRILTDKSVLMMQSPVVAVSKSPAPRKDLEFGLGWFIGQSGKGTELTMSGAGMGFVTSLRLYPDRNLGVFVISNSTYIGRSMGLQIIDLIGELENI